jgi:SAM-dependent methyltransferase
VSTFEQQWKGRFEKFATRHGAEHLVSGWSEAGLRRRVAAFERLLERGLIPAGARVLDLGCGAGTYVRLLAKRGHPTVGMDYSLPSLARAAAADPARSSPYLAGEAYALPFAVGTFQVVLCVGVFQALADPERALGEIARVLASGGVAVVEALNPRTPVAAARRLTARMRSEPTRVRYTAPSVIERAMEARGLRPLERVSIVLPPKSLPGLAARLEVSGIATVLAGAPGLRSVATHAFWILGAKP